MNLLHWIFLLAAPLLLKAEPLKEREKHRPTCQTVVLTVTTSETLVYPSTVYTTMTETVHGDASVTVTSTTTLNGGTFTVTEGGPASSTTTVTTTSTVYVGGSGTATVTSYTFPYATTTVTGTTVVNVPGGTAVTTITYPPPPIPTSQFSNRYTGAPTSLFLSVI